MKRLLSIILCFSLIIGFSFPAQALETISPESQETVQAQAAEQYPSEAEQAPEQSNIVDSGQEQTVDAAVTADAKASEAEDSPTTEGVSLDWSIGDSSYVDGTFSDDVNPITTENPDGGSTILTVRNQILNAVLTYSDSISFAASDKVTIEDFMVAYTSVLYIPTVFNLKYEGTFIYQGYPRGDGGYYVAEFPLEYLFTEAEYETACDALYDSVMEALSWLSDDMTDAQKAQALMDYVTQQATYDLNAVHSGTAYGALVDKKAACQGYALAYKLLLQYAGIDVLLVTSKNLNHMWNLVCMDDDWYHVDPTWVDSGMASSPNPLLAYTKYFLKSDASFASDHIKGEKDWDQQYATPATDYAYTATKVYTAPSSSDSGGGSDGGNDGTVILGADQSLYVTVEHTELTVGSPVTFTITPHNVPAGHTLKYNFLSMQLRYDTTNPNLYSYDAEYRSPTVSTNNTFTYTFVCNGPYRLQFSVYDFDEEGRMTVIPYEGRINPRYSFTVNDPNSKTIEQYVDELAAQAKSLYSTSSSPQYNMALWFHDRIIQSPYDNSLTYAGPAGVLLRKTGTCESYHRAFEMFLNRVGIENNRAEGGGHVWTRAKLDGQWTMIDATWDAGVQPNHLYFGCTDQMMFDTHYGHEIDPDRVCSSMQNNYFIKSGDIEPYVQALKTAITEQLSQGKTEFTVPYQGTTYSINDKYVIGRTTEYVMQTSPMTWNGKTVEVTLVPDLTSYTASFQVKLVCNHQWNGGVITTAATCTANGAKTYTCQICGDKKTEGINKLGHDYRLIANRVAPTWSTTGREAVHQCARCKAQKGGESIPATAHGSLDLQYCGHVQNIGWQNWVGSGATAGTSGQALRVEALNLRLLNTTGLSGGVSYSGHVQNIGWQAAQTLSTTGAENYWIDAPGIMGTSGRALRVEAIKLMLTGDISKYFSIYYRTHAQNIGWTTWVKDGAIAGSAGLAYRLEAIQVKIVAKGSSEEIALQNEIASSGAPGAVDATAAGTSGAVSYNATMHIQNIGDKVFWTNGTEILGTTGRGLRVEALTLSPQFSDSASGGIEYRTHIQNIGWQDWRSAGQMSGTSGRALRLEALSIRLTGQKAALYDVYYRTHIQNIGWTGWAKNGQDCGSSGYAYRMEAMQIVIVPKGGTAPGMNTGYFYKR